MGHDHKDRALGVNDFHIRTTGRSTKHGIESYGPKKVADPLTELKQLNELCYRTSGTQIHAGAAEFFRRKIFSDTHTFPLPRGATQALSQLAQLDLINTEHTTEEISLAIMRNLSRWNKKTPNKPLYALQKWVDGIYPFTIPQVKRHPHFEREFQEKAPDLFQQSHIFYTITMAILAHDEIFHDPFTVILPEIGIPTRVINNNRIISSLEDSKQLILLQTGINIETLDSINIFDGLQFNPNVNESERANLLSDILHRNYDPTLVLYTASNKLGKLVRKMLGFSDSERLDVYDRHTIPITMGLQHMQDGDFVQYANALFDKKQIDGSELTALSSLYVICKAQAERQYYIGEEASLKRVRNSKELLEILKLTREKINKAELKNLNYDLPRQQFVIPQSGRLDYFMYSMKPIEGTKYSSEQMRIYSDLLALTRQLYLEKRQPDLQDHRLLYLFDQGARLGHASMGFGDFKTSMLNPAPQKPETGHIKETDEYIKMILGLIYGSRRTTNRTPLDRSTSYTLHNLATSDPLAAIIQVPEIYYIGGIKTASGIYPHVKDLQVAPNMDLKAAVKGMRAKGRQISLAEQLRKLIKESHL